MHSKIFKVQHSETGRFWNGDYHNPSFDSAGGRWSKRSYLERDLCYYLSSLRKNDQTSILPKNWNIVEIEYLERVKSSDPISNFMSTLLIKSELRKINWKLEAFYSEMQA